MMNLPVTKHEDHRRTLIEWVNDFPIRSCKVVIPHFGFDIGDHHHLKKDEIFYLLKGYGQVKLDGDKHYFREGDCILVKRGVRHSFNLAEGSILLGAATEPFDKDDEIS